MCIYTYILYIYIYVYIHIHKCAHVSHLVQKGVLVQIELSENLEDGPGHPRRPVVQTL